MFKATCFTTLLAAGLMLTGCASDSNSMADGGTRRSNDTGRIDANGNRVYDLGSSDPARVGDSNGSMANGSGNRSATDQASASSKRWKDGSTYTGTRNGDTSLRDGTSECDCEWAQMARRNGWSSKNGSHNSTDMQDGRYSANGQYGQNSSTGMNGPDGQSTSTGTSTSAGQYGQNAGTNTSSGRYGQNTQNGQYDLNGQTQQKVSITPSGKTSQTVNGGTRASGQTGQYGSSDQNNVHSTGKTATTDENSSNLSSWGGHSWDKQSVTATTEADLPAAARTGLTREANGSGLSDISRGMWNGKPAYCSKVTRGSYSYKVVTDEKGDLIAMHRID